MQTHFAGAHVLVVCLSLVLALSQGAAFAEPLDSDVPSQKAILNLTSWLMLVDVDVRDDYLPYSRSPFKKVVFIRVRYCEKDKDSLEWSLSQRYEDFWYANGIAFGCQRYRNVAPIGRGMIYFRPSQALFAESHAATNAALRLVIDVMLRKNTPNLMGVIVPKDVYDQVVSDLGTLNFLPIYAVRPHVRTLLVRFASEPLGKEGYFGFELD